MTTREHKTDAYSGSAGVALTSHRIARPVGTMLLADFANDTCNPYTAVAADVSQTYFNLGTDSYPNGSVIAGTTAFYNDGSKITCGSGTSGSGYYIRWGAAGSFPLHTLNPDFHAMMVINAPNDAGNAAFNYDALFGSDTAALFKFDAGLSGRAPRCSIAGAAAYPFTGFALGVNQCISITKIDGTAKLYLNGVQLWSLAVTDQIADMTSRIITLGSGRCGVSIHVALLENLTTTGVSGPSAVAQAYAQVQAMGLI